ncbi:mitochondrial E3 ubiquitin protein ligase 1 [Coccinella septempunctata]|uniref:mitochondrial E3 ubiquitin protein ligase 1 n=1 Tax=Coccinella septempunctata TaxID=41139 RepID=UPI001D070C50|nr:mitochondrial E3 ubiquitin protein ligase 1 [Coccinella septempunctata]XP_044754067.1 mitochondrial E3 ubiquitin protein ligase 1 [Coccinella septempunctata]
MDYLVETIILGIDSIIFITCVRNYYKNKNAMTMIQGAPYLNINKDLKEIVLTHPDKKLSYVSIRGTVKPLGKPIISNNNADVEGVVQLLRIKEHVIQRSTTGFWNDSERIIQEVHNIMPFSIESKGMEVEIMDPLAADILDMDVISDVFHPTVPSVMDHIWGFFAGIRQRGIQSTEKMLRKGTMITGIGELVYSKDGNVLQLQPPTNGAPFYLTNMQVTSLVKKLESSKRNYRWLCLLFGSIGILVGGLIIRKYLRYRSKQIQEAEIKRQLEESRKERRKKTRAKDMIESQVCVVCRTNPIEIILLPCGHVCLCEDCSDDIQESCPVCRSPIERKSVAYVA